MEEDDYSTDDSSNKRKATGAVGGTFERSKKIYRTPPKANKNDDDKLDQLLNMMHDMKMEQREMRKEMQQNGEEQRRFNQELLKIKQENENLKRENEQIKKENEIIRKELQEIRADLEVIERDSKKNNLIMHGLDINTDEKQEVLETVTSFIKQNLKVNIQPKKVAKIGRKTCVIELKTAEDKLTVMQNKAKLKQLTDIRVYINEDLTKAERSKQKLIRAKAREEKEQGKDVKVGYNKLIVDGNVWRWNKFTNRLVELNTKN